MATFGKLASNNAAIKSLAGTSETTTPVKMIPVIEICPRFENKYISNIDKSKSLQKSIVEAGLIEPINIISIDKYLSYRKNPPGDKNGNYQREIEYLELMQEKGIKYFISSGHRRFKAYLSIFLDQDINTDDEWAENYSNVLTLYEETRTNATQAFLIGDECPKEKWMTIPAIVEDRNFAKETLFYNDSNTTQRELTGFEIIVNTLDELKTNGIWAEELSRIISDRVDAMTDRKVKERVNDLIKANILPQKIASSSVIEQRERLKTLDEKYIPGISKDINDFVVEYISVNKKRSVSAQNVKNTRAILDRFSPKMTQLIFDGFLTFKLAKEILPIYDDIDIEKTIAEIKAGSFKIEDVKEKSPRIKYTNRQLLDLIYEIRNGTKSVEEVISLIEKNEN